MEEGKATLLVYNIYCQGMNRLLSKLVHPKMTAEEEEDNT